MRRCSFITLFGGAAAWPLASRAQQPMKRIAYLAPVPERNHLVDVFAEVLRQRGWVPGRNIAIEYRYTGGRQDAVGPMAPCIARDHPPSIRTPFANTDARAAEIMEATFAKVRDR
jgi:putative ABC transport system substrate-binding protein